MKAARTEEASDRYRAIETWSSAAILDAIVAAQQQAVAAVADAVPALSEAGEAVALRLRAGGRLIYVGAGSPGMMAQSDALELPGTYGLRPAQIPVVVAGGPAAMHEIPAGAEDDAAAAEAAIDALEVHGGDAVLSISASGTTPFAVAGLRRGKARGALAIGMACNAGTPLLTEADIAILLATPAEVIAGSTRMNAGTAQKCALNMLSTLVGIRLGHVHDGMMVNVRVENEKLRRRAIGIIMKSTGVADDQASQALDAAAGEVKTAILIAAAALNAPAAQEILDRNQGEVRASLAALASIKRAMAQAIPQTGEEKNP